MAITKAQIINTVLMRYGNRQGNTALQAQALIEWELMFQELWALPKLPNFLKDSYTSAFIYNFDDPAFDSVFQTDAKTRGFIRFVDPDNFPPPFWVQLKWENSTFSLAYRKLAYMSSEEYTEKLIEADGAFVRGPLTHYHISTGVTPSGGEVFVSQKVVFWPNAADTAYVYCNGYSNQESFWIVEAPQLLIAALGIRMGTYTKDREEQAAFQNEYLRHLRSIYDRDISVEQDSKYGSRGVN